MSQKIELKGRWRVEHYGANGTLKQIYEFPNGIVNQGKNDILDVMFADGTQVASTSWFIGLISNSGYTGLADTDTMASHPGWTEFTSYSETTRQAWGPGPAVSQSITNATPATFSINASGTIKGMFLCTDNVKGGTSGRLWSTALWSTGDAAVISGDSFRVTYTITL